MFVIDPGLRISQRGYVLTEPEIRAEMVRQLDAREVVGKAVAAHLGIAPSRVSEMKDGRRKVQQHEMQPLAMLLNMPGASDSSPLVSEDELTEILAQVHADMPTSLPHAEWPRYVAEALKLRLDTLARDRTNIGRQGRQA